MLVEAGINNDSSIFPVINDRYGMREAPRTLYRILIGGREIIEFPPSTVRICGVNVPVCGGAYFRILPYWFTRQGLRRLNASGHSAVFYLHPWELDPHPPRTDLPRRIALTHYWNLTTTRTKLGCLLREFRFTTLKNIRAAVFANPQPEPGGL